MASSSTPKPANPTRELVLAGIWLTCAVAIALPATLWWGNNYAGGLGMTASAIAAGLCWAASVAALVVRSLFPKPQDVVAGTLGAMLVRMVMVMGGALVIASASPGLVKAAFWGQVVVYFVFTLAVETVLAVRWLGSREAGESAGNAEENPGASQNRTKMV